MGQYQMDYTEAEWQKELERLNDENRFFNKDVRAILGMQLGAGIVAVILLSIVHII